VRLRRRHEDGSPQPWGEPGSVEYWIEAMKRAYELGEVRALAEIERLSALTGPQPPCSFTALPRWFGDLWMGHIAPFCGQRHAMPY
jgi:hypothetical protein